ncbi:MAG: hypothetical protein E7585_06510 [Ruminococcaceae bacterium]|nr:hypothetical protein [Oscillospiraceae bacterium]
MTFHLPEGAKIALACLFCLIIVAFFFFVQLFCSLKIKNKVLKCLPLIPVVLGLIFSVIMMISTARLLGTSTEGLEAGEALGIGIGSVFSLLITVAVSVPTGCAALGDGAAWIVYAILRRRQ